MNSHLEESDGEGRSRRHSIESAEALQEMIQKEKELNSVLCDQADFLVGLHEKLRVQKDNSSILEENNEALLMEIERLEEQILIEKEVKDALLEEKLEELNLENKKLIKQKEEEIALLLKEKQLQTVPVVDEEEMAKKKIERESFVLQHVKRREEEREERKKMREKESSTLAQEFERDMKQLETKVEIIGDLKLEYEMKFIALQNRLDETKNLLHEEKKHSSKLEMTVQKLELERGNVTDSFAMSRRELEKAQLQLIQSQESIQTELDKKEEGNVALKKERDSLLEVKKLLMDENEGHTKTITQLNEKLELANKNAMQFEAQMQTLLQQQQNTTQSKEDVQKILLEKEKNAVALEFLTKQNEELTKKIEELEKANLEMKLSIATYESEKQTDLDLIRLFSDEKEDLRNRIAVLEEAKEQSSIILEEERSKHWAAQSAEKTRLLDLSGQIISLQEKLFASQTAASAQRDQIRSLEESNRQVDDLKVKLAEEEQNRLECVSIMKQKLEAAEKCLSQRNDALRKTTGELEVQVSFVNALRSENGRLKENLNKFVGELEALKSKNQKLSEIPKQQIKRTEAVRDLKSITPLVLVPKRVTSSE